VVVGEKASVNQHPSNKVDGTVHPNKVTDMDEVLGHVPKLMACSVTKFLKRKNKLWTFIGDRKAGGVRTGTALPHG